MNVTHDDLPDRYDIAEEDDINTLYDWHEEALDLLDSLKAQLLAWELAGRAEPSPNWSMRAQSKAGYAGTTLKRIERRIARLGGELPVTVDRAERELITKLKRRVSSLEHFLRKQGLFSSDID